LNYPEAEGCQGYPAIGGGYRRYPWYPLCKAHRDILFATPSGVY